MWVFVLEDRRVQERGSFRTGARGLEGIAASWRAGRDPNCPVGFNPSSNEVLVSDFLRLRVLLTARMTRADTIAATTLHAGSIDTHGAGRKPLRRQYRQNQYSPQSGREKNDEEP